MVKVVGVGAAPNQITLEAIKAISEANKVYGSKRAIETVKEYIRGEYEIIKDFSKMEVDKDAVFLSTGDPMVSGLGTLLAKRGYDIEVVPGISSVQLVLARLKMDLCECCVVDAHAKTDYIEEIEKIVKIRRSIIILGDKNTDLRKIKEVAEKFNAQLFLCENLGYEDERIVEVTEEIPEVRSSLAIAVLKVK